MIVYFALAFFLSSHALAQVDQEEVTDTSSRCEVHEECIERVSLLQTSYSISQEPSARRPRVNTNYGFSPVEELPPTMHWIGDHPRKASSAMSDSDLRSLDERLNADVAMVKAAILSDGAYEASDLPVSPHPVAPSAVTSLYSHQATVQTMEASISWHIWLIIILAGCAALGISAYLFLGATTRTEHAKHAKDVDKGLFPRGRTLEGKIQQEAQLVGKRWFSCCGFGIHKDEGQRPEYLIDTADTEKEGPREVHDIREIEPIELEADTFGMSICSLTRDSYFISIHGASLSRVLRLVTSLSLVVVTVGLQVFLLAKIKEFVTSEAVGDIRDAYDKYEVAIYGQGHTTLTVNGKHRGNIPMPPLDVAMQRLATLSDDDQSAVCHIPLSQPNFFGAILLIWTLLCCAELKRAYTLQQHIIMLKTVPTMAQSLRQGDDISTDSDGVIEGMTVVLKVFITLVMFVPRVLVTLYLLWLGCRWLLATTDFGNLVSNAVALEFILLIKEGLYAALTPFRSHLDLQNTKIDPYPKHMRPSWFYFVSTVLIFVVACLWVYMYMHHFQAVLPEYKWDVHAVCANYMANLR